MPDSEEIIRNTITKVNRKLKAPIFALVQYVPDEYCWISCTKLPPEYHISIDFNPTGDWNTRLIGWIVNKHTDDELCFETPYWVNQIDKMVAHFLLALRNKNVQKDIRQFINDVQKKTQQSAAKNTAENRKQYQSLERRFNTLCKKSDTSDKTKEKIKTTLELLKESDPDGWLISRRILLPNVLRLDQILAEETANPSAQCE